MQYISLGRTGSKVSRLCLGCTSRGNSWWRGNAAAQALPLTLSPDEVERLEEPYRPHAVLEIV